MKKTLRKFDKTDLIDYCWQKGGEEAYQKALKIPKYKNLLKFAESLIGNE